MQTIFFPDFISLTMCSIFSYDHQSTVEEWPSWTCALFMHRLIQSLSALFDWTSSHSLGICCCGQSGGDPDHA